MADVVAILQSDPALLRCQLHRLDAAVDLELSSGDVLGVGYYENGKVLLRKRPAPSGPLSLEQSGQDVRSDLFFMSWHAAGPNGFQEGDTAPYRFRSWLFASKGRLPDDLLKPDDVARLPQFLQRGLGQASAHELVFFTALSHIHADAHPLDHLEIDPQVVVNAVGETLADIDARALQAGLPAPQTTTVLSNGRMIVAARRGRPLSYALLEGMSECEVCGITRETSDRDPRVRAHRTMKAVALTTRVRKNGIQWVEAPENHVLTVDRSLAVKVTPLPG